MTGSVLPIAVRVVEYELPGALEPEPKPATLYRLITTIVDEKEVSSQTLAQLYRERWTIETTLAEMKTTLKGSAIVLRSKTPNLVRQTAIIFIASSRRENTIRPAAMTARRCRQKAPNPAAARCH